MNELSPGDGVAARARGGDDDPVPPAVRPANPRFSSGPCTKHPGWDPARFDRTMLGRSHRAASPKRRLATAIDRASRLMQLPDDWVQAIVPASDTGAFELAMWSLLGPRGVDALVWESFSKDWATDLTEQLAIDDLQVLTADYGELPELTRVRPDRDLVFVYNGTTSGVRVPDLDFIAADRQGLALCDATSAVLAMDIDYSKLDVVTWSWQKVLGGEAGFGMLALGPRALERLRTHTPAWPLPKIFRLVKKGAIDEAVFSGSTLNTPSMLAVEDLHSALDWAESLGGLDVLVARSARNFQVVDAWVARTPWVEWLPKDPATRSSTSMCLAIADPAFSALDESARTAAVKTMCGWLEEEQVAYDIAAYRTAPPGFRLWGGATVEAADLEALLPWLDWAFTRYRNEHLTKGGAHA